VLPEDLSGNPHVQRGIREEPEARRGFEDRHGVLLLPICAESTEEPILRASFDGLTDEGRPVEIKAPTEANFRDAMENGADSALYRRYYAQVQTQVYVSESDLGYLALHCGELCLDIEITRDDNYIARLVEASRTFREYVRTGKEPPLDPERDLYVPKGADQDAWFRLAAEYRQLDEKQAVYAAEAEAIGKKLDELEAQLLTMMGEFTLAESSGVRISRYLQNGAVDYKAALKTFRPDFTERNWSDSEGNLRNGFGSPSERTKTDEP
jgi:putative phage-type endonuclease